MFGLCAPESTRGLHFDREDLLAWTSLHQVHLLESSLVVKVSGLRGYRADPGAPEASGGVLSLCVMPRT